MVERKAVVLETKFSTDTRNVSIAELILRNERAGKSLTVAPSMEKVVAGSKRATSAEDVEAVYSSEPRKINCCYDLYKASYMRNFGRSKIKTTPDPDGLNGLLVEHVLNANNFERFRNGERNYILKDYKIVVARKINPNDELINALKSKLDLSGNIWVLCDPYIGEKTSRFYFIFDTVENPEAGRKFREMVGKKESSGLFLIACRWQLPPDSNDGTVMINLSGKDIPIRCSVGHIKGRNIYELPNLNNEKNIEPHDLISILK